MRTFEVLQRTGDRWLLASVFDKPDLAISDAKTLMDRARTPIAVRVMAVQEHPSQPGFIEWCVFRQSTFDEPLSDAIENEATDAELDPDFDLEAGSTDAPPLDPDAQPSTPRSTPVVAASRPAKRRSVGPGPRMMAAALILLGLGGVFAMLAHRASAPREIWIFDTPEAQKPHLLRNSMTGEFSR